MEKCNLLIKNAVVMTDYETVKKGMDIAVSGGRIAAVTETGTREFQADKTISGEGKLFMPGLIDSHMHTGQQLLKGLVLDAKPIIWTRVMLPFESTLTPEKMRLSAQVAALEMMKSGTTAFIDAGSYHMDAAAAVYEESGLRGCISYSTMDEEGLPESIAMNAGQAVEETDRLYENWNGKGNLKVYYSLRALNSCSHELTELAAGHARERGAMLQAHMNEYQGEVDGIIAREGMRPYEYLEKMGVLSDRFLGAHSLILSEEEKEIILSGDESIDFVCDRNWLMEAVINIVKNALDHTEKGGFVWIEWKMSASSLQIAIKDNGTGIHPEDLYYIFKRFYRSRYSKDTQGIGLGLPLAKSIIEAHGGSIAADSGLGAGSAFYINFPTL